MMWPFSGIITIAVCLFLATMMVARIWYLDHKEDIE